MERDGRSYKWTVLLIACIGSVMGPLDSTIVSVTLPTISQDLGMGYTTRWVPTSYLAVTAALLLSMGRLSDMRAKPITSRGSRCSPSAPCCAPLPRTGAAHRLRALQGVGSGLMATATP